MSEGGVFFLQENSETVLYKMYLWFFFYIKDESLCFCIYIYLDKDSGVLWYMYYGFNSLKQFFIYMDIGPTLFKKNIIR